MTGWAILDALGIGIAILVLAWILRLRTIGQELARSAGATTGPPPGRR
jgi:hypothetical protein